jgi:tRNA-specific 2-thiouridylase
MFHTLGQRQGLGIGGVRGYPDSPWYVLHKDLVNNDLYVGQDHEHPWLMSRQLRAEQLSWVSGFAPEEGARLSAKVRYRQADQACTVRSVDEQGLELVFERPQRAVTPGQSVVLYDGENCLGGGIIDWADTPPTTVIQPDKTAGASLARE